MIDNPDTIDMLPG